MKDIKETAWRSCQSKHFQNWAPLVAVCVWLHGVLLAMVNWPYHFIQFKAF